MRIVFIGTGEIGRPTLRTLLHTPQHQLIGVITQPDKPVGRDQQIQAPPIKAELGYLAGAGSSTGADSKRRSGRGDSRLAPDVIVVMAYGQILPKSVLEIPRIACLNLHASLLPRYRGAAPIQAAIAAGDAGDRHYRHLHGRRSRHRRHASARRRSRSLPNETGGSLHDRLAQVAPDVLLGALDLLAKPARTAHLAADRRGHVFAEIDS